jgi:Domain of unknown function (DUF4282)
MAGGTCSSCGRPMDASSVYCVHCGAQAGEAPRGDTARVPAAQSPPAPKATAPPPPPPPPPAVPASAAPPAPAAPAWSAPPPPAAPVLQGSLTQRGFFASLFDMSFTSLIATRIIKVLYIVSIIAIGVGALIWIAVAFNRSTGLGVLVLFVIAPLLSLLYLIWTRVLMELFIALFRIMENTSELVAQGRRDPPG